MIRLVLIILFSLPLISFGQYKLQTVFINYNDDICYTSLDTNFIKTSYSNEICNIFIDYDTINKPFTKNWTLEFINNSDYPMTSRKVGNSNNLIFGYEPSSPSSVEPYQEFTINGIVSFPSYYHFISLNKTITYSFGFKDKNNKGGSYIILIHIKGFMNY